MVLLCSAAAADRPEVQLEYKYVVRSQEGALYWKPGDNCQIKVPVWLKVRAV